MAEREPDGTLDLGDLQRRWSECQRVRAHAMSAAGAAGAQVLCPRNVDEPQVGGHRVYAAAERYITIADENHDALVSLLEHHGATPTAPWNLLRPTFEASFYARWLLRPEDSIGRRRRGIQLEWLDDEAARRFGNLARSNTKLLEELGMPDAGVQQEMDRANTRVYAGEASKVGLTYRTHDRKGRRVTPEPPGVNVSNELARLESDPMVTLGLQTTWSTLSGIQHSQGARCSE